MPGRRSDYPMALALAALAGAVDAVGFVHGHTLFASFMSGNSTVLGVATSRADWSTAGAAIGVIGSFVGGVVAGESLGAVTGRRARPMLLLAEALLLGLAAAALLVPQGRLVTPLLSFAMGLQNSAVHKAGGVGIALTYVTGTLVHVGRGTAAALRGAGPWRVPAIYAGLWCSLVAGAAGGVLAARDSEVLALAGAAGIAVLLAVVAATLVPRRAPG